MDYIDRKIANLKFQGKRNTDIAELTKVCRTSVIQRLKKPEVKEYLESLNKSASEILINAQTEAALELIRQIREGKEDRDKREAAKEILRGVLTENHNLNLNNNSFEIIIKDVKKK